MDCTWRGVLGGNHNHKEIMKHILLLISVITLVTSTGCIFPGHRGGGGEFHDRGEYRGGGDYREQYPEPGVTVRIRP